MIPTASELYDILKHMLAKYLVHTSRYTLNPNLAQCINDMLHCPRNFFTTFGTRIDNPVSASLLRYLPDYGAFLCMGGRFRPRVYDITRVDLYGIYRFLYYDSYVYLI